MEPHRGRSAEFHLGSTRWRSRGDRRIAYRGDPAELIPPCRRRHEIDVVAGVIIILFVVRA
jgi:hypothetical protein